LRCRRATTPIPSFGCTARRRFKRYSIRRSRGFSSSSIARSRAFSNIVCPPLKPPPKPTLVASLPPVEWDKWRVYIAGALGLSVDDLRRNRFVSNPANFAPRGGAGGAATRHIATAAEPPPIEREILAALVDEPALVAEFVPRIPPETFRDERYREIYRALCAAAASLVTASDVYAVLGDDRDAVALIVALQKPDRSSKVRFPDSPTPARTWNASSND